MIVGIDEVGRGAWAGPLVVGAVLLGGASIEGLTDSKALTRKQREVLDLQIRQRALGVGLGWVSAKQIDQIGLSPALKLAARRAVAHLRHSYEEIIIDGTIPLLEDARVTLMKKADLLVPSVSAASIVAKVARDNYMRHLDTVFPGYTFKRHVGYGTALHRQAIGNLGASPVHRLSFSPLHKYQETLKKSAGKITSRLLGDSGEDEAARYLSANGHEILARNWRTKYCEIDIVSRHRQKLYFTEVKYRKNARFGGGIAAVTPAKLKQMAFAAEMFLYTHKITNTDVRLAVADVEGEEPHLTAFVELD